MRAVVKVTVLILIIICVMVGVYSIFGNTGPALSNHSYVNLTKVGDRDDGSDSVQCHTDLETCCHRDQGDDHGDWYFPDEIKVPFDQKDDEYERRRPQEVNLRHNISNGGKNGIIMKDTKVQTLGAFYYAMEYSISYQY